jgi:hypothetical protein
VNAPGKKRCRPLEGLIGSGAFKAMTQPEQSYVVALDYFTNRDSGLCYPSERIITERLGLSRSRQQEGRKRCLARKTFSTEMRKVNRKGNAVTHYIWPPEAWKGLNLADNEPRPDFDTTQTQYPSNPDPISKGGNGGKSGVHMGSPDPNQDGVRGGKPLLNPLINSYAPHPFSRKEKRDLEVKRALRAGQNLKGPDHTEEYWNRARILKEQGFEGEALTAALEKEGIK